MRALLKTWVAAAVVLGSVSPVYASNSTVVVLGIRSSEGDDDFTNRLTDALREQAVKISDWKTSQRSMSLDQMTLAYNCEELDAACLAKIASGLGVKRIIYGTCRRNSARDTYDYIVALSLYDADSAAIEGNATDLLSSSQTDKNALTSKATILLSKLNSYSTRGGTLAIRSNVESAEVRIDEEPAGRVENGTLIIGNVASGQHTVEVLHDGYEPYQESVTVSKGELTTIISALCPTGGCVSRVSAAGKTERRSGRVPKWVPYTLFGVGGAFLVGTIVSWVWINSIENDPDYKDYRARVGEKTNPGTNVCDQADKGLAYTEPGSEAYGRFSDVQKMCARGETLEVLQFVFLGVALVSGTVGAYLLFTQTEPAEKEAAKKAQTAPAISFRPLIGRSTVSFNASVKF